MYYVYILVDEKNKTYVGLTTNVAKRLDEHNQGLSQYTKRSAGMWRLKWYCAFKTKDKAAGFEKYLKTGSGIAFFKKRLI